MSSVSIVIATRNRSPELARTLSHLIALPSEPPLIVVDNASDDATAAMVRSRFPTVRLITLNHNAGAAGRNIGVRAAHTPYVAFSDDDSWWEPEALPHAAELFDRFPSLALVTGRTLVGPTGYLDPISVLLARSPLPGAPAVPGPGILGFLACTAIVRRSAFLGVGGFSEFLGIGGEERLLAYDLAAAGWALRFAPGVVARHHPSSVRDPFARRTRVMRNDFLIDVLRRSPGRVAAATFALLGAAWRDRAARKAASQALRRLLAGSLPERRPLPPAVEAACRRLEAGGAFGVAA